MDTPDTYVSLFFGYSAIWAIMGFFVWGLVREQRKLRLQLDELKRQSDIARQDGFERQTAQRSHAAERAEGMAKKATVA